MAKNKYNYISLFSGAGVGCYGFKIEDFECIVSNELLKKRLDIQKFNKTCKYQTGYIVGNIQNADIKNKIFTEIEKYKRQEKNNDIDIIIATPPCQGMSIANHKKGNEKKRNSLVIESIEITKKIKPRFFVFENVRSFLNTICTDIDKKDKKIREAIETNLSGNYNILFQVINFKNYGNNSSRTRTLVIGTRKDLQEITPLDIFPNEQPEKTLKKVIGNLPPLSLFGEINKKDIYHNFKPYAIHMLDWIKNIHEGQSAFDNINPDYRPHKIIDGKKIINQKKNGDKYTRCYWDKIAPCVHTRNDILASQSTIHPVDNRVFSIRELMRLMTIPDSFRWVEHDFKELNNLKPEDKKRFLAKEEINIRQSIGEAVPTEIFRQIAIKIKRINDKKVLKKQDIDKLINNNELNKIDKLTAFIIKNKDNFILPELFKIIEIANSKRLKNSAFYTRQDICFSLVKELPEPNKFKELRILEPSVGTGNFLPLLINKYKSVNQVIIDVIDIDKNSISLLKELTKLFKKPKNVHINFINQDFLQTDFSQRYDIVIGNPPFGKIVNNPKLLEKYKKGKYNAKTNNIFSFFIEEALKIGNTIALISPKSLLSAPEFNLTRELLSRYKFQTIIDYGEKGFSGVKIETIGFVLSTKKKLDNESDIKIESDICSSVRYAKQNYLFSNKFPVWLIYRDNFFDIIAKKMEFNIFDSFRDRKITKKYTKNEGKIRVLKSRNIANNRILNIENYDSFIDDIYNFPVKKYLNNTKQVLIPNLTYNPRACFLPKNTIADGSVAILTPKEQAKISAKDIEYYNSKEFIKFYMITRNLGTRSLNIDKNSVFFFGKLKNNFKI